MVFHRERYNARRPSGFTPQQEAWLRQELQAIQRSIPHPTVIDGRDFGLRPNSGNDQSGELQNTISAAFDPGSIIQIPAGVYIISTGLTSTQSNIGIMGVSAGMGQDRTLAFGAVRIQLDGAIVGLTFNDGAAATKFHGPKISDLMFAGDSDGTSLGGVLLRRCNNYVLDNVVCCDFPAGYGFKFDGALNVNQYGVLRSLKAQSCLTGLHFVKCNHHQMFGGHIDGNRNDPSGFLANSTGIITDTVGGANTFFGVNIQGCETSVDMQGAGAGDELFGCRYEAFDIGVRVRNAVRGAFISGGSWDNNGSGGGGTGVQIDSGALETTVHFGRILSVGTQFTDAGTDSIVVTGGSARRKHFGTGHAISSLGERSAISVLGANATTMRHHRATNTNGNGVQEAFSLLDSNSALALYASMTAAIRSNTAGSHEGAWDINVASAGTLARRARLDSSGLLLDAELRHSVSSPAQITATQDNYDVGKVGVVRLSSDASQNITGLVAPTIASAKVLVLVNIGANDIVLQNQHTDSTAANRIITGTGADITIAPDDVVQLLYDSTTARWRVTSHY